jgi:hypothetical protein
VRRLAGLQWNHLGELDRNKRDLQDWRCPAKLAGTEMPLLWVQL